MQNRRQTRFDGSSFFAGIWLGLLMIVLLIAYMGASGTTFVNCPEEDSCYADYYAGTWHIVPGER